MAATLGQLAAQFGCELVGDAGVVVNRVGTLSGAAPDAVTLAPRDRDACPVASLVHPEPYLAYARIASSLHPPASIVAGVHASAVVAASARVAAGAQVDAQAVIGGDSSVADDAVIGAGAVLGTN